MLHTYRTRKRKNAELTQLRQLLGLGTYSFVITTLDEGGLDVINVKITLT